MVDLPKSFPFRSKPSEDFLAACQLLSEHLPEIRSTRRALDSCDLGLPRLAGTVPVTPWCLQCHVLSVVSQEWFQVSSHKASRPEVVAAYLGTLGDVRPPLLEAVVNLPDRNGNTALHYSVSHSNFPVAKLLLDTGQTWSQCPSRRQTGAQGLSRIHG
uniref:Uncharacterized protein n=1 Tax=Malurus cyaneus samueli TaxID=2593467 RepID=A0A8C5U9Y8_9PASS